MAYNNNNQYHYQQQYEQPRHQMYQQQQYESDATLARYPTRDMDLNDAERGMSEVPFHLQRVHTGNSMHSNESTHTLVSEKVADKKEADLEKPMEPVAVALPAAEKPKVPKYSPQTDKLQISRWTLWQLWFNTYKKFFVITIVTNIVFIALTLQGKFPYAENHSGALVLGNLLAAIVVRNELFARCLYLIATVCFSKWAPLFVRLGISSTLQHLGGVHTGCSISAFCWLVYKIFDIVNTHGAGHPAIIATGIITACTMAGGMASAIPWVRMHHHNVFESLHRFLGWTGLVATWFFVILGNAYIPETKTFDTSARRIISGQAIWFAAAITVLVLLPWVVVQKVDVEVEIPSAKVAVLKFKGGMQHGLLARISRTPLGDYHAFGTISESLFADHHYLICGVQGDFTKGLVSDMPKQIWTRTVKFAAVGNTASMYRRGIRVMTGTGLGAGLSTCIQEPGWFLIWCGSDQEKTFGKTISELIYRNIGPERRILWDSKKEGKRPDLLKLVTDAFYVWRAEVVMITSNGAGNDTLMQGLLQQGIPAFGTLWDF